jgi:hypothetical protein
LSARARRAAVSSLALYVAVGAAPLRAAVIVDSSDPRCVSLPGRFPPGRDFGPGAEGVAAVANFSPGLVVPVDVEPVPPEPAAPGPFFDLRSAIAADACSSSRDPELDGVVAVAPDLALATASSCECVAFIDPRSGGLRDFEVGVPAGFAPGSFPFAPAPGTAQLRAAVSTRACVTPPPPALDSFGAPIAPGCDPGAPSYLTSFTSGVARVGDRLFVATSNIGSGAGTLATQFLPGTVLVFDLDLGAPIPTLHPNAEHPVLFTSGFNPTDVTPYTTPGGRALVLVSVSGATGLVPDDPHTPEREAGGVARSAAAIDVIDAVQARLVATIPLGLAALSFDRLAVDPSGRIALAGSSIGRRVYAADLAPLDGLDPDGPPVVLDGSTGPDAVIFDADAPLELPALAGGAAPETCPGFVVGIAFAADGRRALATDFCDGTLSVIPVRLSPPPPVPVPPERFGAIETVELVAPLRPDSLGLPRALGALRVRPGVPGADFQGPDALFLVGLPEGLLCGIRVPEPGAMAGDLAAAARRARRFEERRR